MRQISPLNQFLFLSGLFAVLLWQTARPLRSLSQPLLRRWFANGALFAICRLASVFLISTGAVATAALVAQSPIGLLNRPFLPYPLRIVLAFLLIDLFRYVRHRLYHSTRLGWRIHQVHHSDPDLDVTTALRFHPLEDLLTGFSDVFLIALLAPPPPAVVVAEGLAIISNLLIHANASIPQPLETVLSWIFITPDLHRVHHSADRVHQQANLGIVCSLWDRSFRTLLSASPTRFGLSRDPEPSLIHLPALLAIPFRARGTDYTGLHGSRTQR